MKHYKDTATGEYYGFKANSNCVEITVAEIEQEREAAKTPEQLKEEARLAAKTARDNALNDLVHVLADGSVVQTRPSDLANFDIAIKTGVSTDWVLADNTVRTLTVTEMQECLDSAIAAGKVIWTQYTEFLKAQ